MSGPDLPGDGLLTAPLMRAIVSRYALPLRGRHGLPHWARVLENGLLIARETGADPEVVSLFAVFHDACRVNEGWDHGHGARGADLATSLRGRFFDLDDARFDLLHEACARHTDGLTTGDPTVLACWDADRLDLGRVHITPDPARMATGAAARPAIIEWAEDRSRSGYVSPVVAVWERWSAPPGA